MQETPSGSPGSVLATLHAPTQDELETRAMYLASALMQTSSDCIHKLVMGIAAGDFGEAVKDSLRKGYSQEGAMVATKMLTCASISLLAGEHGSAEAPEWYGQFVFDSMRTAEAITKQVTVRQICLVLEKGETPEELGHLAAGGACQALGLGADAQVINSAIEQFLSQNQGYRTELLKYALSKPQSSLEAHIQTITR